MPARLRPPWPRPRLSTSRLSPPSVTINRDSDEGRQITLRGLGPDFTRTQLNGMEVLGNTASGMDNRGGVSRTRSFDYSLFASELFDSVIIQKSYAADQDEGGIGGTVRLSTAKPFDYDGFKVVLSGKGQSNSVTKTVTPRLVGLISDRWGDFGALAAAGTNALTGNVSGTQVLRSDVIQGNTLVAANYTGVDMRSEFNTETDSTRFYQTVLHGSDQLTDALLVKGLQPVQVANTYHGPLPAGNLAFYIQRDLVARLSANRDISRPARSDLAAAGTISTAPFGGGLSIGNPNLKPFTADAVEGSLEFYPGKVAFVSVGAFYKKLNSFISP